MPFSLVLVNPLGGIGQDIVGWFGRAISAGLGGFASWAIDGVIHAMVATTTPGFTSWFAGPWRAMLTVVAWLSVPILFVGVGTAALRGDLTSVLKRGLGAPVAMAVGTAVAIPVTAGVLTLVNACCGLLVTVALGNQGFSRGLGHLADFALSATLATGGSSLPGLAATLIVALAGFAALVIWFVLALRGALLYLEVLAMPLALCGLYWGGTAQWIKRLVDLIIATILSQLVITMLMVLAAADLDSGQLSQSAHGGAGPEVTTLFLCLAFLVLGSLALPMALRHVPAATEHAATAASQISAPGRMTYMGTRVAGTAGMMRHASGRALVEAGVAGGPLGAAAIGARAAADAATTGASAAGAAAGNSTDGETGTGPGAAPSPGAPGVRGTPQSPHSGGSTTESSGGPGTAGATASGPAPSRGPQAPGSQPGHQGGGGQHPSASSGPSDPGGSGAPGSQSGIQGAANRTSRAQGSSTPTTPGRSHG